MMKKTYWASRILPCFMIAGVLLALIGCKNNPMPNDDKYPSTSESLAYPKKVALLLPLQGDLGPQGNAIKDGFFAAYYIDAKKGTQGLPTIMVLDTHGDKDILPMYQKALSQGADFVVGPLTKPALATLMKAGDPQVPILALNTGDIDSKVLYQFGLSPENEASQAAIHAAEKGNRHALLFIQEGEWGKRVANAFEESFRKQGGDVREIVYFSPKDNLSEVVRDALHISANADASLRKATATKRAVPFVAKARDDVDMVFMAAMPMQARQIPPLLAFYYAKSWPIYATSSVYSGTPNPKVDQDLSGVTFCDIPWLIEMPRHSAWGTPDDTVMQLWPTEPRSQTRLYALGVDAYEIVPLVQKMSSDSQFTFDGATGGLSMNDHQQIQRVLPCTQFVKGEPLKQQ